MNQIMIAIILLRFDLRLLDGAVEQAPRVDRPPSSLCFATKGSLPATQGQRYAGHAKATKSLKDATKISAMPHGLCCLDRLLYNSRKDKLCRS